jgi:zinc transporter, ZIP family
MLKAVDIGYVAIPVAAAAAAGVIAAIARPGARVTSALQHFAAGVVFAAAAIELVPKVLRQNPGVAIAGFSAGIAVMFAMRAYTERLERRQEHTGAAMPAGLIGATAVDFLVDGGVLGAGFTAGGETGLLLTLALTIEYLFVGLSIAAALGPASRKRTLVLLPTALALLTILGAAGGIVLLTGASAAVLAGVLAFGAVAFMYLVTEELLVEAHEHGETASGSALFFVGFLLFMVLTETLG